MQREKRQRKKELVQVYYYAEKIKHTKVEHFALLYSANGKKELPKTEKSEKQNRKIKRLKTKNCLKHKT